MYSEVCLNFALQLKAIFRLLADNCFFEYDSHATYNKESKPLKQ